MRFIGFVSCKENFVFLLSRLSQGTEQTKQNENTNFVLRFTKSTTHELRNEVSHFLLTDARMTRSDYWIKSSFPLQKLQFQMVPTISSYKSCGKVKN